MSLPDIAVDAIRTLPGELQEVAGRFFERLNADHELPDPALMPNLARVAACSEFAANTLLREWHRFRDRSQTFGAPLSAARLEDFVGAFGESECGIEEAKASLRRERNRLMVQIYWRDICNNADVSETLASLSLVADQMIRAACQRALRQMRERFGDVRGSDNAVVPLVVLGMGKLGGSELNFSSDIDIIFAYSRDGNSDGGKQLAAQPYFDRMSRLIVALLDEVTADGFVYRTDTRLRPFGDSGPPVVSFAALESYLLHHGRDWERYAYVKARLIWPQSDETVRQELFDELISPFVYRRYLDYGVFESLRDMHNMISAEVKRRDLADNVKLGPGGIREIEFIVQTLQLIRGGGRRELRSPSLQAVLPLLVNEKGLAKAAAESLGSAYAFLRKLENGIQAIRDAQTHDLPVTLIDRVRLCVAMNFSHWDALTAELRRHRDNVSRLFKEATFGRQDGPESSSLRKRVVEAWETDTPTVEWQQMLADEGFDDAGALAEQIVAFRDAPATKQIGKAASQRLKTFMPRLIQLAKSCQQPARAMVRCLAVVEQVRRRSAYLALLNENRLAAERLVRLCDKSAYIARELARFPVLLDELLDPGLLQEPLPKAKLLNELQRTGSAADDIEVQMEQLARYQRSNLFRIAVADFNDVLPIMKVSDSLTFLAEAVLEYALQAAWADLVSKHGVPCYEFDGELREAGFGIIAYGKLGGLELSYGSDLDVVFLHDSRGTGAGTNGDRPLDNTIFYSRLVRRLVHILTTRTSTGELYEIDTRLRPSGRKGLLVSSVEAFDRYQQENAWTWEHQALLRARPVAGSPALASAFEHIRVQTLTSRVRRDSLQADVIAMRERMRKELDRSDAQKFDLKHGRGGVGDIEFIVQYLVLKHAAKYPDVIEFTDNIRQLDALAACGLSGKDAAAELQGIYRAYRRRQHHLVLNDESLTVPATEFEAERAAVVRQWERVLGT